MAKKVSKKMVAELSQETIEKLKNLGINPEDSIAPKRMTRKK